MPRTKIVLKSGKDQSPRRFHPWIFSGAIKKIYGNPVEGDVVDVYDNKDEFLAVGHYQPGSIAVRILSFKDVVPDIDFFTERVKSAIEYRRSLGFFGNDNTNVYRLVHAEGDDLPGLDNRLLQWSCRDADALGRNVQAQERVCRDP